MIATGRNPTRWLRTFYKCLDHVAERAALLIYQLVNFIDAKFGLPGSYSSTKRAQVNVACQGRRPPREIAAKENGWAHGDSRMPCQRIEGTNPWHGDECLSK